MPWGFVAAAAVGAVGSMAAADSQASAAQDAANTSAAATNKATEAQERIYQQQRTDQTPWRDAGKNALDNMVSGMGSTGLNGELTHNFGMADYQADPGYAFRVSEGQKALERSAAARGGLYSGRAAKDLTRFGQDQGSHEYQAAFNRFQSNQTNQFNRLASVAGLGQTANNALAQSGTNYANSVGNLGMTNAANQGNAALAAGNARASGYTGLGNALGNVNWGSAFNSSNSNGYGSGYDSTTGLGNTSVNYGM